MQLLPLSLCLLTLTGSTFSDGNVPVIIRVKEGNNATLSCNINKDIKFERFEWKKDGKKDVYLHEGVQLSDQDDQFKGRVFHLGHIYLKDGDASITIIDTKVSDSGFYTCHFPNLHQTFTVRLVVGLEIITVTEGSDVILPCKINKNIVSEEIEWMKDGKKAVSLYEGHKFSGQDEQFSGRVSHFDDELKNGDASITISDTKVSDSGVYTCNFPNLHQTFTVHLVVGPVIVRVKEGDNVILPCKINKDILSQRFDWMKDGKKDVYLHESVQELNDQDDQFRDRVSHFDHELKNGNASITISDTKVSDSGVYTCHLPNLHQTFTVRLVVGKAAKVSILNPEQTEEGFLLQCLVLDVSPGFKLNISWFDSSGNKLIEQKSDTESEKLHILQTTVKNSGTYRCVATMEELSHQVHSEVHVKPGSNIPVVVWVILAVMALIIVAAVGVLYKLWKEMKHPVFITVTEGSDVILPCYMKINILSKRFKWKKDGEEVVFLNEDDLLSQDDEFRGRVSQLKDGDASITIYDTKVSDSGFYTCNSRFYQTSTVHLRVEPLIITATEGDEATLSCNIKKNIESVRFEWMKDGKKVYLYECGQLPDGQDDQFKGRVFHLGHIYLKNGDASITIYGTKLSDSGVYTCNFPNLHQTFTVRLRVEPLIIKVTEGDDVILPCNIKNEKLESQRFEWKKDGRNVYLYEGGQLSGQDEEFRGRVSHFDHELRNGDASITISKIKASDSGVYTCNFPNLHQTSIVRLRVGKSLVPPDPEINHEMDDSTEGIPLV